MSWISGATILTVHDPMTHMTQICHVSFVLLLLVIWLKKDLWLSKKNFIGVPSTEIRYFMSFICLSTQFHHSIDVGWRAIHINRLKTIPKQKFKSYYPGQNFIKYIKNYINVWYFVPFWCISNPFIVSHPYCCWYAPIRLYIGAPVHIFHNF